MNTMERQDMKNKANSIVTRSILLLLLLLAVPDKIQSDKATLSKFSSVSLTDIYVKCSQNLS